MNPALISIGFKSAKSLWKKFNDDREEKTREAYAALEKASSSAARAAENSEFFPRSRKEAGKVTQAAHHRLERALEEFSSQREEAAERLSDSLGTARAEGTKFLETNGKKARKLTKKQAKKARKLARKEESNSFWSVIGFFSLIAAAAGVAFYFLRDKVGFEKEEPSTEPPRVEEFNTETEGSRLVYTSSTEAPAPADAEEAEETVEAAEAVETSPEEGATERDEELLGSLEEQLSKHREQEQEDK